MLRSVSTSFCTKENIYFSTYEGESLHGLLFKILAYVNPSYAEMIHEDLNKFFTISNLIPFTTRQGNIKVLEKGIEYKFRITFLNHELFEAFMAFFNKVQEPLLLNGVRLFFTKIRTNDPTDPWCEESTFEQLLEGKVREHIMLQFLTPTSFRRVDRQLILPEPESVFGNLVFRWKQAGGCALVLGEEAIKKIEINRYELKTRREQFKDYSIKGFTGECEFWLGDLGVQERREAMALARFAFYSGVGYKTTMGLGQVKMVK